MRLIGASVDASVPKWQEPCNGTALEWERDFLRSLSLPSMFQQDFIVRQVQQLAEVLARVLFHKRAADEAEAQEALSNGLAAALGLGLDALRTLSRDGLVARYAPEGAMSVEMAVAVAEVLQEDAQRAGRLRALWLYEAALASGAPVPFDIHERIDLLREELG